MNNLIKRIWNYIANYRESMSITELRPKTDPEVLSFAQWLSPVTVERDAQYREAFKAVFRYAPLPIKCMQCDHEGMFYDKVSKPQEKLIAHYYGKSQVIHYYEKVDGECVLLGKCANCGVMARLQIPTIIYALEKRKEMKESLNIPEYITRK